MEMETGRKQRLQEIREKLANLSDKERNTLIKRGLVATVEGRTLSLQNTLMVYLQADKIPTVVGGYRQWQRAGKQVKKGEHGMVIWFPVGEKDADDDIRDATHFFTAIVFDVSQVDDLERVSELEELGKIAPTDSYCRAA
jgi:hypothetical protein